MSVSLELYATGNKSLEEIDIDSFQLGTDNIKAMQFGTQARFRWSRDRKNRTAENAFSAP